jgi:hypothetical protein
MGLWSKQDSTREDLALDAAAGFFVLVAAVPTSLLLGGFSFFQPWAIIIAVGLFSAGYIRGGIPGNPYAKAAAMNTFPWFLILTLLLGQQWWWGTVVGLLITFASALAGAFTRRFVQQRKRMRGTLT